MANSRQDIEKAIDVVLGEAVAGDWDDMLAIASTMANRASRTGLGLGSILGGYVASRPAPGTQQYRDLAEQAVRTALVSPSTTATHYYSPKNMKNPPSWASKLGPSTLKTAGHIFYTGPAKEVARTTNGLVRMGPIGTAFAQEPTLLPESVDTAAGQMRPGLEEAVSSSLGNEATQPPGFSPSDATSWPSLPSSNLPDDVLDKVSGAVGNLNFAHGNQKSIGAELSASLRGASGAIGRDLNVTSGLRSYAHNLAVGGKPNSFHLTGKAADIDLTGMNTAQRQQLVSELASRGITNFITYTKDPNMLHVDNRVQDTISFMHNAHSAAVANQPNWMQPVATQLSGKPANTAATMTAANVPVPTPRPDQVASLDPNYVPAGFFPEGSAAKFLVDKISGLLNKPAEPAPAPAAEPYQPGFETVPPSDMPAAAPVTPVERQALPALSQIMGDPRTSMAPGSMPADTSVAAAPVTGVERQNLPAQTQVMGDPRTAMAPGMLPMASQVMGDPRVAMAPGMLPMASRIATDPRVAMAPGMLPMQPQIATDPRVSSVPPSGMPAYEPQFETAVNAALYSPNFETVPQSDMPAAAPTVPVERQQLAAQSQVMGDPRLSMAPGSLPAAFDPARFDIGNIDYAAISPVLNPYAGLGEELLAAMQKQYMPTGTLNIPPDARQSTHVEVAKPNVEFLSQPWADGLPYEDLGRKLFPGAFALSPTAKEEAYNSRDEGLGVPSTANSNPYARGVPSIAASNPYASKDESFDVPAQALAANEFDRMGQGIKPFDGLLQPGWDARAPLGRPQPGDIRLSDLMNPRTRQAIAETLRSVAPPNPADVPQQSAVTTTGEDAPAGASIEDRMGGLGWDLNNGVRPDQLVQTRSMIQQQAQQRDLARAVSEILGEQARREAAYAAPQEAVSTAAPMPSLPSLPGTISDALRSVQTAPQAAPVTRSVAPAAPTVGSQAPFGPATMPEITNPDAYDLAQKDAAFNNPAPQVTNPQAALGPVDMSGYNAAGITSYDPFGNLGNRVGDALGLGVAQDPSGFQTSGAELAAAPDFGAADAYTGGAVPGSGAGLRSGLADWDNGKPHAGTAASTSAPEAARAPTNQFTSPIQAGSRFQLGANLPPGTVVNGHIDPKTSEVVVDQNVGLTGRDRGSGFHLPGLLGVIQNLASIFQRDPSAASTYAAQVGAALGLRSDLGWGISGGYNSAPSQQVSGGWGSAPSYGAYANGGNGGSLGYGGRTPGDMAVSGAFQPGGIFGGTSQGAYGNSPNTGSQATPT